MAAKTVVEVQETEKVINNMDEVDLSKLNALKEKAKNQDMAAKIVGKKEKSWKFGVIGSGQAGSRIASVFYEYGYDAVVVNTAMQDLKHINVPEANKLLLEYGAGGAAKELMIGHAAAEAHKDSIRSLIHDRLNDCHILILCTSLGGGSGAGSVEVMVEILSEMSKPLMVMTVLPMDSDDDQTKHNALETLSKLAKFTHEKKINNLIVIDNSKLEVLYGNVNQLDFFNTANRAIVEPLDTFNTLSAMASAVKPLDPTELSKLLIGADGLTIYGELTVENYLDDTAIAEAIVSNLNSNLLASGFDLKQSRYAGFIIAANKKVWSKIPSVSITYASAMLQDACGVPSIFKGIYEVDLKEDVVKVYSIFSGLGLPESRVAQLKKDAQEYMQRVKQKDEQRNVNLQLDTGVDQTVSAAQRVKEKMAQKSSAFGKLLGNVVDRRK